MVMVVCQELKPDCEKQQSNDNQGMGVEESGYRCTLVMVDIDKGLVHIKDEQSCHPQKDKDALDEVFCNRIGTDNPNHAFAEGQNGQELIAFQGMREVVIKLQTVLMPVFRNDK